MRQNRALRSFAYLCFALALAFIAVGAWQWRAPQGPAAAAQAQFDPRDATTTPGYYTIERVVDGDTIIVWKDGEDVTVRLIGMDTPETVDPRKDVQCFGPEASSEGKRVLTGQDVRLVPDPTQDTYDKYGRYLAYVYLPDGTLYNQLMIEKGYAHEYTYKKAYELQKEFKAAQTAAAAASLGFWSPATCNGETGVNSATTTAAR
ncbi:MAG TPA: thermonuclease family protein [Candidatus Paceibacterota bacterium]